MRYVRETVAIVTGGGRGMGAAIARELAAQGYALALTSPRESCEMLATELGAVARRGKTESADDIEGIVDLGAFDLWPHRRGRQPHRPSAEGRPDRHLGRELVARQRH